MFQYDTSLDPQIFFSSEGRKKTPLAVHREVKVYGARQLAAGKNLIQYKILEVVAEQWLIKSREPMRYKTFSENKMDAQQQNCNSKSSKIFWANFEWNTLRPIVAFCFDFERNTECFCSRWFVTYKFHFVNKQLWHICYSQNDVDTWSSTGFKTSPEIGFEQLCCFENINWQFGRYIARYLPVCVYRIKLALKILAQNFVSFF